MAYTGDGGWETRDLFFGLPFLISLILLLGAIGTALLPYHQSVKQWNKPVILFLLGVASAFAAVILSELT
jgi:hypothetical protein